MVPYASTAASAAAAALGTVKKKIHLVVLYGVGGLSDVGRHAILAALEPPYSDHVVKVSVVTEYPELLDGQNWECGCVGGHTNPSKDFPDKVNIIPIDGSWNATDKDYSKTVLQPLFSDAFSKITKQGSQQSKLSQGQEQEEEVAVISCLGHRQPGWKYKNLITRGLVANSGSKQLLDAIASVTTNGKVDTTNGHTPVRVVAISSVGIQEDWPPMEWNWFIRRIMSYMLRHPAKLAARDLTKMESNFHKTSPNIVDYLFVRPVGISEEAMPKHDWHIQREKFEDKDMALDMAKMDVARYMVSQIINPTCHRKGVVIGGSTQK
mmetsp:Transcript_56229/g.136277  ORF Transcript_56229/g.136277 Transcript_56229/m.136277 type:complete len:322 (-) Transcript_56229:3612-4577(-)